MQWPFCVCNALILARTAEKREKADVAVYRPDQRTLRVPFRLIQLVEQDDKQSPLYTKERQRRRNELLDEPGKNSKESQNQARCNRTDSMSHSLAHELAYGYREGRRK